MKETVKFPTKVMVWGMFTAQGVGRLHVCEGTVNAIKYIDILERKALPQLREWFGDGDFHFQQDSAPCHTAKVVKAYLLRKRVPLLDWPGNSPDLNPIENLWAIVKSRMECQTFTTKQALIEGIIKVWHHECNQGDSLKNLVESMPRRLAQVIYARGGHTFY